MFEDIICGYCEAPYRVRRIRYNELTPKMQKEYEEFKQTNWLLLHLTCRLRLRKDYEKAYAQNGGSNTD